MSSTTNSYEFLPGGQTAPTFTLTAVKSGRQVSPKDCAGRVLGLVFHGQHTAQAVVDINVTVRPQYPEAGQVTLASVVDLSSVPRLLHRMVKPVLEQIYDRAASEIPPGFNPPDYVFLLPDWNGKVTKAFRVKDPDKTAAIVVINGDGVVVGSYQGPQPGPAMLRLVQQAKGDQP